MRDRGPAPLLRQNEHSDAKPGSAGQPTANPAPAGRTLRRATTLARRVAGQRVPPPSLVSRRARERAIVSASAGRFERATH
jgi:hypothetical protein